MTNKEPKFSRLLVGTDDSRDAQLAFNYAIDYALKNDAELFIVSVLESDEMNIYQALDDDYIHGEKSELENHLLAYKETAKKQVSNAFKQCLLKVILAKRSFLKSSHR
jgi:Universal stress protein family.